jgi:hypothetical protein
MIKNHSFNSRTFLCLLFLKGSSSFFVAFSAFSPPPRLAYAPNFRLDARKNVYLFYFLGKKGNAFTAAASKNGKGLGLLIVDAQSDTYVLRYPSFEPWWFDNTPLGGVSPRNTLSLSLTTIVRPYCCSFSAILTPAIADIHSPTSLVEAGWCVARTTHLLDGYIIWSVS